MNTTPISRDAVEQALEALTRVTDANFRVTHPTEHMIAESSLRAAIAQADQPAVPEASGYSTRFQECMTKVHDAALEKAAQRCEAIDQRSSNNAPALCAQRIREMKTSKVAKPEPQAQAGGPEILTSDDITLIAGQVTLARKEDGNDPSFVYAFARALEQRVLQSHREAIAKKDAEAAELRAALVGCVEAMKHVKRSAFSWPRFDDQKLDAAITQAQEHIK